MSNDRTRSAAKQQTTDATRSAEAAVTVMRAEMKRGARKIATLGCRDRKRRGREGKHLGASLKSRGRAGIGSTGSEISSDEQGT